MADEPEVKEPVKKPTIPARPKRICVDEARERYVTSGFSTVVFRPGQLLESQHLITLARDNGVQIREV